MSRRLQLTPYFQRDFIVGIHDAFRLKIAVTDYEDIEPEIFCYLEQPLRPGAAAHRGYFSHVATPVDIETHPVDAPFTGADPRWFRKDYIDLLLRSRTEALELWQDVQDDVAQLLLAYRAADLIIDQEPVWFGGEPALSSSSSSSSSVLYVSSSSSEISSSEDSSSSNSSTSSNSSHSSSDSSIQVSSESSLSSKSSSSSSSECYVEEIQRPSAYVSGTWLNAATVSNINEVILSPDKDAEDGENIVGLGLNTASVVYTVPQPVSANGVKRIVVHVLGLKLDDTPFDATVNLTIDGTPQSAVIVNQPLYTASHSPDLPTDYGWGEVVFEGPWASIDSDIEIHFSKPSIGASDAWIIAAAYVIYQLDC